MLKARVVTALFLVAGFLAVLFWLPAELAVAAFVLVPVLGAWEWARLMQAGTAGRLAFPLLVMLSCLLAYLYPDRAFLPLWGLAVLFWLAIMPAWLARGWRPGRFGYFVGWLLLVPTWAALVGLYQRAPLLLLAVMASVWVADSAAYFTGRAFGRHKLAPAISPGKTWEGVGGAVVGVLVYGLFVGSALPNLQGIAPLPLAAFLLLLTAFSIIGDLFESLIKRQAGMKDSSQLLPGHGGILDRIDSQTSTLPLVALTLQLLGR